MKCEFEFRTDAPSIEDGFRFLVLVYDKFTKGYHYQLADYSPRNKEWRKPKTFEKLENDVIGWCVLPDPKLIAESV